jgi:excisionase family DNA binding protein
MRELEDTVGVEEGAREWNCHGDTLRRAIADGRLSAVKVLGRYRIRRADLKRMMLSNESGSGSSESPATPEPLVARPRD